MTSHSPTYLPPPPRAYDAIHTPPAEPPYDMMPIAKPRIPIASARVMMLSSTTRPHCVGVHPVTAREISCFVLTNGSAKERHTSSSMFFFLAARKPPTNL